MATVTVSDQEKARARRLAAATQFPETRFLGRLPIEQAMINTGHRYRYATQLLGKGACVVLLHDTRVLHGLGLLLHEGAPTGIRGQWQLHASPLNKLGWHYTLDFPHHGQTFHIGEEGWVAISKIALEQLPGPGTWTWTNCHRSEVTCVEVVVINDTPAAAAGPNDGAEQYPTVGI